MENRAGRRAVVCVLAALILTLLTLPVGAAEVAEEHFALSFPIYANGGSGFSAPWTQGGFNAAASRYTARARSLCYPQLESAGGSVSGEAVQQINGAIRTLGQPLGADNTTVYISFLLQPRGTLNDGIFNGFFGLTLNGSLGNDLFIGKPGGGAPEQYVLENRGGAGQAASGVNVVIGRTTLLVVKAQFLAGNDVFTLYVNPRPGHPEPVAGNAVKSDVDLGTVSKIGIYSTGAFAIDEIRIGSTFADVTPVRNGSQDKDFSDCREDGDRHDD